ncbi:MAG: flavin reductase family protein [Eubacteriales bacterium]|jgi:flavin reductase (DIM6/NTAB) family NADH-FMN oxidoreductase RutF|nr:flavin reductase family protein [Eubacteriales bacterium]
MAKIKWKGSTLLAPVPPVLVTCGDAEKSNVLTVGWTGIINSKPPKTYVSLKPERYSHGIISQTREFVINLTTAPLVRAADFCGIRSGRDIDKFSACSLETEPASGVGCPLLSASPLSIECVVSDILRLGSHDMFIADIVAVDVNEELVDREGRLHLEDCGLAAYAHGDYFALGRKLGSLGFSVRKKRKSNNKNNKKQ